jgi:hypothetical protein
VVAATLLPEVHTANLAVTGVMGESQAAGSTCNIPDWSCCHKAETLLHGSLPRPVCHLLAHVQSYYPSANLAKIVNRNPKV